MKKIYKIAKAELQCLFFSPIAWLILILFTFQTAMVFTGILETIVKGQTMGNLSYSVTPRVFGGWKGLFSLVLGYLHLYIPLLTMSLMSRELSSGSIKLLYSSPVSNTQIILGKYLSMIVYGLLLVGVLSVYVIFAACTVENFDYPVILVGLLGIYLLICAYTAIGLFMSSLTSYQIVAAVGTLAILSLLSYVRGWWQDIAFIRDLTYWLAMPGRSSDFIDGVLSSEGVIYFIIIVCLFLAMAIIRLQSRRQHGSRIITWGKYLAVWTVALLIGYVSSRPALMALYDATRVKSNTLTQNSQEIMKKMTGGLTITTYTNVLDEKTYWYALPKGVNDDKKLFQWYTRFKPEIKFKYVYYYADAYNAGLEKLCPGATLEEKAKRNAKNMGNPKFKDLLSPQEVEKLVDIKSEGNRFFRVLERESGEKAILRTFNDNTVFPKEAEMSAALKRLVAEVPKVGFLTGHEERNTIGKGDRDYNMFTQMKTFRYSLVNQGFDLKNVTLEEKIPEDIKIVVIAEMKKPLTENEQSYLDEYIARGGNLLIIGEPGRQQAMNPMLEKLGVEFMPGMLVHPQNNDAADLIFTSATEAVSRFSSDYERLYSKGYFIAMPGATGLKYEVNKGFEVTPMLVSDSTCWNEIQTTDFIDEVPEFNPETGEVSQQFVTGLALSRQLRDQQQRIIILGDADCISNGEFMRSRRKSSNYSAVVGSFFWLSNGEMPIDVTRPLPIDKKVSLSEESMAFWKIAIKIIFPALLFLISIVIWLRRRGR